VSRPHNMKAFLQERNMGMRSGRARLIYDAEAIFAERDWLQAKTVDRQLPETALAASLSKEIALAKIADAVVVVTQRDGATMARAGVNNVYVVGHRLDPKPSPAGFGDRRTFLFIGAMHGNDDPNADSMRYFCGTIWPAVHLSTGSNLIIAGYGTTEALADLRVDGVNILGCQNDLTGLYNEARVFIVPTRYAAGIPLKALEAAAFGVPLVVSGLIGEQLGWEHGKHCLIADDPTFFAEGCCRAYEEQELWEQLRSNGLERVKSELNEETFRRGISEAISAVEAYHGRP
jgi:O-antigen biosynthesis protein